MTAITASARSILLQTLLRLCRTTPSERPGAGELRVRVLTGPLRGMSLQMPGLARPSFALGTYERHVVSLMRKHVRPGVVAYDIGAHIGYLTLVLSRLTGPSGHVYSFEPDPANLSALKENLAANRIDNVTIRNEALAETPGTLRFAAFGYSLVNHIAGANEPEDAQFLDVAATSLDHLVYRERLSPPGFIKIDVEGAEARVLRGAERVLSEFRPVIVAEIRNGPIREEIASLLRGCHYEFRLARAQERRMEEAGLADVLLLPSVA